MFTQVYFQHTRRAFDHHIAELLKILLVREQKNDDDISQKDKFPPPTSESNIRKYLQWDDWRVFGLLSSGAGGELGEIFKERKHYRSVFQTREIPQPDELDFIENVGIELDKLPIEGFIDNATSSWYKIGKEDIAIRIEYNSERKTVPLSSLSSIVKGLAPVMQQRIYVPFERKQEVLEIIKKMRGANLKPYFTEGEILETIDELLSHRFIDII